jgi:hypothetical protein
MALMHGRMKVTLGATVTPGTIAASDDAGRCIAAVASAGNWKLGVILVGGDADEVGEVLLFSPSEDGGS